MMVPRLPALLKQVRRIEITARRLVSDLFAGQYSSTFKGRGMEFAEVRDYLPGDDVRSIDWNVTARLGHPYVKKFIEERELTVMFLVDVSGSLQFGTRGQLKAERAAEITALLSFSALRNNDKVGLILFTDRVEKFIPPRKNRGHVLRLIREVLAPEPTGRRTSLKGALDFLNQVQRRRAVVFLLSDFIDDGFSHALRVAQKKHDVIAVPIIDARERELPRGRHRLLVEDAEGGGVHRIDVGRDGRIFQRHNAERLDTLLRNFRRWETDAIVMETGPLNTAGFYRFFQERARRAR